MTDWTPRRDDGSVIADLAQHVDPNADLIGKIVEQEGKEYRITCTPSWSNAYVLGEATDGTGYPTCFVAAYLR